MPLFFQRMLFPIIITNVYEGHFRSPQGIAKGSAFLQSPLLSLFVLVTALNQPVHELSEISVKHDIPYRLTTLQMAGYVAADKDGSVTEAETAPSSRWNKVEFTKGSAFSMTPDLTDGVAHEQELHGEGKCFYQVQKQWL